LGSFDVKIGKEKSIKYAGGFEKAGKMGKK